MAKSKKVYEFEAVVCTRGENFNFAEGDKLQLGIDDARELMRAESVRPLDPTMPASFYPSSKSVPIAPGPEEETSIEVETTTADPAADDSAGTS